MIDIKKLVLEKKTVTIDYPEMPGLQFDLCYLGPEALKKLRDRCMATRIDKKTRAAVTEIDDEKFTREFCLSVVNNWKGFKAKYLSELLLVDLADTDPEEEVEYNAENCMALFTGSSTFAMWVNEMVFDLTRFR